MKYKNNLAKLIIVFSIILLSASLGLAIHLNISPIFGLGFTFIVIIAFIYLIPEKYVIKGKVRE